MYLYNNKKHYLQANALEELRRLITYMNTSGMNMPPGVAAACAAAIASVPSQQSFSSSPLGNHSTITAGSTIVTQSQEQQANATQHQDCSINSTRSPDHILNDQVVTSLVTQNSASSSSPNNSPIGNSSCTPTHELVNEDSVLMHQTRIRESSPSPDTMSELLDVEQNDDNSNSGRSFSSN